MKLKKLSIIGLIIGILAVVVPVGYPLLALLLYSKSASIGIIGGADGPTAIFITHLLISGWTGFLAVLGIVVIIVSLVLLFVSRKRNKN